MIPAPSCTQTSDLADWIELSCLKSDNARISRSDALDQLIAYIVPDAEEKCDAAWVELERRQASLGAAYPFAVKPASIERRQTWMQHVIYTSLTLMSAAAQFRRTRIRNYGKIAKTFENVVLHAVARYIGGRAVRVGHPRESPVPKSFSKLLPFLAGQLGEGLRRSKPLVGDTKDCRADIIAWRPFADGRGNKLVVFLQCAIGHNWIDKLSELDVRLWERYIEFVAPPTRAFAIPFVEPNEDPWLEYGTRGGIAFDRIRIVELLAKPQLPQSLLAELRKWSQRQLQLTPWDP